MVQPPRRPHENDWRMAGLLPACSVPEIANVFNRCQIPFFQVTGRGGHPTAWEKSANGWPQRSRARDGAQPPGCHGSLLRGMLDIYSD